MRGGGVCCGVAAYAACRHSQRSISALKSEPLNLRGERLPTSFLKHADEQTICAMVALSRAMQSDDLAQTDFAQWGVLAAPRFLGRSALALALTRFTAEGAWGISPHLIPHRSLHALSGTVSQALRMHGPNFGVGGGAEGPAEALLAAVALLADQEVPGLWLLFTGFDPELVPADPLACESASSSSECLSVAMALLPPADGPANASLTVHVANPEPAAGEKEPPFCLEALVQALANGSAKASWRLPWGAWAAWNEVNTIVEFAP
jgi:hypothetical protein